MIENYFRINNYKIEKKKKCDQKINHKNYNLLYEYNHTIPEIKSILKNLNLPCCKYKKKYEILHYAINILFICGKINMIQKCWRNHFIKQFNETVGPSFKNKKLSNNVDDFYTAEELDEIDYYNYFSYKDNDGFIYTFNIVSIHSLIQKRQYENPYNRKRFSDEIIHIIKKRFQYNKILHKTSIFEVYKPAELSLDNKLINLFNHIDELGNYSSPSWFNELSLLQTKRFIYELFEIWNFRAQLSHQRKREICPPSGNPFYSIPTTAYMTSSNVHSIESLRTMSLSIMEKLVYSAQNDSDKNIGALYILSSLTLVSNNARNSLPWLYASVNYIN